MTYSESAEGVFIDEARIAQELRAHHLGPFLDECLAEIPPARADGKRNAGDVLRWSTTAPPTYSPPPVAVSRARIVRARLALAVACARGGVAEARTLWYAALLAERSGR